MVNLAHTFVKFLSPNTLTHANAFLPQLSITRFTSSTPALHMLCQLPTLHLLLNVFHVELLFIETPLCLAWPVILLTRNKRSNSYLPIFPKEHSIYLIICLKFMVSLSLNEANFYLSISWQLLHECNPSFHWSNLFEQCTLLKSEQSAVFAGTQNVYVGET